MKRISSLQGDRTHPAYLISRPAKCLFFFLFFLHTQPTFAAWDSNSNGMSDLWEKQFYNNQLFPNAAPYQLADDPDRDGWNNEKEAIAGTHPFNANAPDGFVTPEIVQEQAPGTFTLTWPSIPGKTYQLQTSETLQQGSWIDCGDALLGDGDPIIKLLENESSNSNTPPKLFYHVAINDIDQDGDGLTDAEEYQLGTHPTLADSDTDGLSDRAELLAGLYPNNPDCDLDGILDGADSTPLVNNAIANPDGAGLDPSYETNLIGRWDFEKSVSNSNDTLLESSTPATVGAFDISGTSATWDGRQGGIYNSTGMPSSAVQFSEVGAFGKLPGTVFDNKNTETWCMWIKFPTAALDNSVRTRTLFSMGKYKNAMDDSGLPYLHAYFNGLDETFNLDTYWISGNNFNRTGLVSWPTPANLDDGKFHHLAITFRPDGGFGKYELYYDGELVSEHHSNKLPSLSFSQSGSEPYTYIGRKRTMATANEETLGATIDRLRIYQTRLTATSIAALYNQDIDRDSLWDITESQTRYSDFQSSVVFHPDPTKPNAPLPTQIGYARSPFFYSSGSLDFDQDELNDLTEQSLGTMLSKPDTDDDNLLDGFEVAYQLNPLKAYSQGATKPRDDLGDPDLDSVNNLTEYLNGSNPRNANSDGDSKGDAAEIAQGSNPANAADSGKAPSDPPVQVPFHLTGDYTAWEVTIQGKGPNDTQIRRFRMSAHNAPINPSLSLQRGNAYELSLRYIRTKPGETVPWYCWEASIDGKNTASFSVANHWVVDNSSALLAQHTHSHGTNQVADKKVNIVPVAINWKAIDGFDNLSDHIDPWSNPVQGKRIFPDYKNPNDTVIRHKLEVIVKTSPALQGKTVFVKAFDVDDSTSETFDTAPAIIDTNGKAGSDNLSDYLNTPQNGQFWTGKAWGNATAQGVVDANGETKFIFKVGMQPGNNYRIVASVIDDTMYAGVQTTDPSVPKYLGPEASQNGAAPATPLLTVWRRLWVENDSMEAIPTDSFGYKRNDLSADYAHPTIHSALLNSSSNTSLVIPIINDSSSFSDIQKGQMIFQGASHSVVGTLVVNVLGIENHSVVVSGNHTAVPIGSEFRLYDDDDQGLNAAPLPRINLVDNQMKNYFKTSFIDVTDAADFNLRKFVPFRRNQDVYSNSTVVDDSWDLTDKNALWVCPITTAYQGKYGKDHDPSGIDEGMSFGDTSAHGDYDHSTVYVEGCREQYDNGLRSINPITSANNNTWLNKYIIAVMTHEMGHQPADQSAVEDHAENSLMSNGLDEVNTANSENAIFSPKTVIRFRKANRWSK